MRVDVDQKWVTVLPELLKISAGSTVITRDMIAVVHMAAYGAYLKARGPVLQRLHRRLSLEG